MTHQHLPAQASGGSLTSLVITGALVAAGVLGAVWLLIAVACTAMVALMMRGMGHDGHDRPL